MLYYVKYNLQINRELNCIELLFNYLKKSLHMIA